jgi:hypothetical protein
VIARAGLVNQINVNIEKLADDYSPMFEQQQS